MSLRALLISAGALATAAIVYTLAAASPSASVALGAGVLWLLALALVAFAWQRATGSFAQLERIARDLASGGDVSQEVPPVAEAQSVAFALEAVAESLRERAYAASLENEHLKAALNSSADAVLAVDAEGRIAFANVAAGRLFGRDVNEMIGNPFVWVMADAQVVEAVRASRDEARQETTVIERPNRQFLRAITSPIVGGGAWSTLVVVQDLTDVRRVEQVRRDFVANVSHELRTPLAALKSVIETLESGALEDHAIARDFLARADTEVERMVQMVEELLELSRIESGEVPLATDDVDLSAVVLNAVERVRRQAERGGLALTVDLPDEPLNVRGDAVRLERAVLNLLHNAVKFTPAGGSVHVTAAANGREVSLTVSDTGIGIDPEDLPRVFERFYKTDRSRRAGGTGLGLAVVKHTVEAHGGRAWAESEPDKGSRFGIVLPLRAGAPEGAPTSKL